MNAQTRRVYESDYTDAQILHMLDRIERQGASRGAVAIELGVSRAAVCGLYKRVCDQLGASEGAVAVRPENQNGGMPARWWKVGLARQIGALV